VAHRRELRQRGMRTEHDWAPRPSRRSVGPVGTDSMSDHPLAELERCDVDTKYCFRADAASPRTLILLDDTGERTIIAVDRGPAIVFPARTGAGSQVS
jgi:hypothetical protein